jgi:cell filamentation protein
VADDPYVYPGTNTLRNRWGVRDAAELTRREAAITAARLAELAERPTPGNFDLAHLQAFHRRIFGDVYEWAGQIRTVSIAKDDLFALPQHIEPYLGGVLRQLRAEDYLHGIGRERLIDLLTHYFAEINSAHPFREGNGRTQRAFLSQLAAAAGYQIEWARLEAQRNIDASRAAHRGDNRRLRAIFDELTSELENPGT